MTADPAIGKIRRRPIGALDVVRYVAAALIVIFTLIVGVITLGTGRTTVLQGIVHLVIFAAFLFFAVVP